MLKLRISMPRVQMQEAQLKNPKDHSSEGNDWDFCEDHLVGYGVCRATLQLAES